MTARIGCLWEEKQYFGFGSESIVKVAVRTRRCLDTPPCPYKCGGPECRTAMKVYDAEPLTSDRYAEIMLNGYSHRPRIKDEPSEFIHQTRWRDDSDGGEPQISFRVVSIAEEMAELGMEALEEEQPEGATA